MRVVFALLMSLFLTASPATFGSLINTTRTANGLATLQSDSGLRAHAQYHAERMAAEGRIYHSSAAELRSAAGAFEKLGENVGRGGSAESLHQAFMNSSGHRANILGDYTHMGIGAAEADGIIYVAVVFMKAPAPPPKAEAPPVKDAGGG